MPSFEDFHGLTQAIQLKVAIQEADSRSMPAVKPGLRTVAEMAGIQGNGKHANLPIYNENDVLFAVNSIGDTNLAVTAPGDITEGSLIEFENDKKESTFGIVIEPPASAVKRGIYVRNLTKEQITQLHTHNPHIPKVHVNNSNLKPIVKVYDHADTPSSNIFTIVDPLQKMMFRFLKETLRVVTLQQKNLIDILLWIYLLVLLVVLIAFVYYLLN